MSQLDEAILDALTHVTFPNGFAHIDDARRCQSLFSIK